ncbi:CopG family transcriptional regulator [Sphingomonas japonica]|uniref:Arc/MetJ-type ribon-helix-helix transcriptional regulator n=1 Tax=Sphingomonas japonica TaxID=511662 RepID=A0ABX0U1N0_9SPHN|nr:CopG family transcriptional regulator [Sphingomonas japonica]NIJ23287.1 Arc/MetJ-type ribon-helix-helix transcriptional regulator [Sphingomonas japonica]
MSGEAPLRARGESEKITINLGFIDLGQIDLMVADSFYANRSDFIRSAIRNQLERHADATRTAASRRRLELGVSHYDRALLATYAERGETIDIRVLGLATIAADVTPDLARGTIASVAVLGAFHASPAVKAAIADRIL